MFKKYNSGRDYIELGDIMTAFEWTAVVLFCLMIAQWILKD